MGISSNLGTAARSSSNGRSDPQWGAINATNAAVVLGARNLGAAITSDLLERGVRVAAVARTRGDLDLLERGGAVPLQADAADPEQLGEALAGRLRRSGRLT